MAPQERKDRRDSRSSQHHHHHSHHRPRRGSSASHRKQQRDPDTASIDSGYGGSSATPSPQIHGIAHPPPPPTTKQPGLGDDSSGGRSSNMPKHGGREESEGEAEYDPRDKYYISVDDEEYRRMSFQNGVEYLNGDEVEESGKRRRRDRGDRSRSSRRRRDDDDSYDDEKHSRRRSTSHRHRSHSTTTSSSRNSDSVPHTEPERKASTRRPSDSSSRRPHSRRDSSHRRLSPIPSEPSSDGWHTSVDSQRSGRRRRRSSSSEDDSSDNEQQPNRPKASSLQQPHRRRRQSSRPTFKHRSASSTYEGAADMDDAWYKTFKERLTKGVDMDQVKKVGFDAACVAAVKVAVGTQVPWKQRIPKTIAVGLAAAVTDFLVSKTGLVKPKGMVGTMFMRQFVEIILANAIVNPVSNKVTTKFGGGGPAKGGASAGATKPAAGGGGRRK